MFRKNLDYLQNDLFSFFDELPETMQNDIRNSQEYYFYHLIFKNIPEEKFAILYSDKKSRPNAPVNCLVAATILKERNDWTYEQLFDYIKYNLLLKVALGLNRIGDIPFCPASYFNFQNRLNAYRNQTGKNLLETVFDELTQEQIKKLEINTTIQRIDSTFAASNIRNYSRLQLLIEMLIRVYRVLSDSDRISFQEQFSPYVKNSSEQYIYRLKGSELPHEMEKVGQLYYWIYQNLYPNYRGLTIFQTFERVYNEHFTVVEEEKITVKPPEELTSDCLQSPDDLEATYRFKNGQTSKGQVINAAETAHPDNQLNLVTDVAVSANNVNDDVNLHGRLDKMKKKTPDLDEAHVDGAYGSTANDEKCKELGIQMIQTAVKGRQAAVPIEIELISEEQYQVSCPSQTVVSTPTRTRHKALFDLSICQGCSHQAECPLQLQKHCRVYYFNHEDYLNKKRQTAIWKIPKERRFLRNNVEATMHEFACKMRNKKLKVRGAFKAEIFAYAVAISINFGRIYRYLKSNPDQWDRLFKYFYLFVLKIINRFYRRIDLLANQG